jgi:hypothetical protein
MIYSNPILKIAKTDPKDPSSYLHINGVVNIIEYSFKVRVMKFVPDATIYLEDEFQALAKVLGFESKENDLYARSTNDIANLIALNCPTGIEGQVKCEYVHKQNNNQEYIFLLVSVYKPYLNNKTSLPLNSADFQVYEFEMAFDVGFDSYTSKVVAQSIQMQTLDVGIVRSKDLSVANTTNITNYEYLTFDPYDQFLYILGDRSVEGCDINSFYSACILLDLNPQKQEFFTFYSVNLQSGIVTLNLWIL